MESRDRLVDTMLKEEMRRLNTHLPKQRRTLQELLALEDQSVQSVDGNRIIMKKTELQDLAKSLPENLQNRVKLPLVMMRRTELGAGAFTLLGDSTEEYALSTILTGRKDTLEDFRKSQNGPAVFYKPQVSELLRRFHSLVVIGFGVSDDFAK
jgi:uncharacterized protein (UPF0216 family)